MTSLARQLQQLTVPHTQTVLGQDKQRASLLFDPKEAASLDNETLYALGINGLVALENINPNFYEFEKTLFSESSKTFERTIHSQDVNKNIDNEIARFLLKISPYFLLKPAQKTIEWLIYRYHIQNFNEDDLMRCILPYHETKIFVRALQVLPLKQQGSKWTWLQPLQISGLHLSSSALIRHCAANPAFLGFICDMVKRFIKAHNPTNTDCPELRVLFTFFASTIIGVLEKGPITESVVAILIPPLTLGLESSLIDHEASAYMILSQLMRKVQLKEELLHPLLRVMIKRKSVQLSRECLMCIVLMYQTQQQLTRLPKTAFKHLFRTTNFVETLASLSDQFKADKFIESFIHQLIPKAFDQGSTEVVSSETSAADDDDVTSLPQYLPMLEHIMQVVQLTEQTADNVTRQIVVAYIRTLSKHPDVQTKDLLDGNLQGLLRVLEARFATSLELAIDKMLLETKSEKEKLRIREFLSLSLKSVQHHLMDNNGTNLVLGLNHRQPSMRQHAIKHMIANLQVLQDEEEVTFVEDAIINRLCDDNAEVISTVLQAKQVLWSVVQNHDRLYQVLKDVLAKTECEINWAKVQVLNLLGHSGENLHDKVAAIFLPFLFLTSNDESDIQRVKIIVKTPLMENHQVYKHITMDKYWKEQRKGGSISKLNHIVIDELIAALCQCDDIVQQVESLWRCVNELPCRRTVFMSVLSLVISRLLKGDETDVDEHSKVKLAQLQLKLLLSLLPVEHKSQIKPAKRADWSAIIVMVTSSLEEHNQYHSGVAYYLLQDLIKDMRFPETLFSEPLGILRLKGDNSLEDDSLNLMTSLLDVILEMASSESRSEVIGPFRQLVLDFFKKHFVDVQKKVKFLSYLWTSPLNECGRVTIMLQARALQISLAQLTPLNQKQVVELVNTASPVVSGLLLAMTSEHRMIREAALNNVSALMDKLSHMKQEKALYYSVLRKLNKCREEIITDHAYIQQALQSAFKCIAATEINNKAVKKEKAAFSGLLNVITAESVPDFMSALLLQCLIHVNNGETLSTCLPMLKRLLAHNSATFSPVHMTTTRLLLERFTVETCSVLTRNSDAVDILCRALNSTLGVSDIDTVQEIAIGQITKVMYSAIQDNDAKKLIIHTLFNVLTSCSSTAAANLIRKNLKHLVLEAEHLVQELSVVLKTDEQVTTVTQAKKKIRRKSAMASTPNISPEKKDELVSLESCSWHRVTVILEVIQTKKKLLHLIKLVPVCFRLLAKVLELSGTEERADYIAQLLLASLYNITSRLMENVNYCNELRSQEFSVALILQCIRTFDNPHTHHQALLLLTIAAKLHPEDLLHNVMSVFTFMGASILRQDDSYSFQVISKILETVIPALMTACDKQITDESESVKNAGELVTMVMRVFIDAFPHIPVHRRPMLFTNLLRIVGEEDFLWRIMLMFTDLNISKGVVTAQETKTNDELHEMHRFRFEILEFVLWLSAQFPPHIQLLSCTSVVSYLSSLPRSVEEYNEKARNVSSRTAGKHSPRQAPEHKGAIDIFNISAHSNKQLRHFRYESLEFLVSLLTSDMFIQQLAQVDESSLLMHFQGCIEAILKYISDLTGHTQDKTLTAYWKQVQHKCYDCLDKVVDLLPIHVFFEVIYGLLGHELLLVQRKAIELLSSKLQHRKDEPTEEELPTLLSIVHQLISIVRHVTSNQSTEASEHTVKSLDTSGSPVTTADDVIVNGQTALFSLKLLCRQIGRRNPDTFIDMLKIAIEVVRTRSDSPQLCACGFLCIAEMCNSLSVHVIAHLSVFMPLLIQMLDSREKLYRQELLLQSVVTAAHKVVENLSHFISPFLLELLMRVCHLSACQEDVASLQKPQVKIRIEAIRHSLATALPTRVILPVMKSTYTQLADTEWDCIKWLMCILGKHIERLEKEDLNSYHNQLLKFILTALDFRITQSEVSPEVVLDVEESVIKTLVVMVMKLSEATFRPLLFKLYDWATRGDVSKDRLLVFYRISDCLAEKLRSLFTLFAGHLIKHASALLDQTNVSSEGDLIYADESDSESKCCALLIYVLDCLYKCFLYDKEGFLNKERFDSLMQPLVDQIENELGGDVAYTARISDNLVPCIAQFAVASQDDTAWRTLNYQILLKTRSTSAKVRYAALLVLNEVHQKLGEDYMSLLPETIPFLAELMEDESEEVEQKCQSVIGEMEKTLGEPLQKYF